MPFDVGLSVRLSVWPCGGVLVESSVGTGVTCRTKVTCRTDATSHRVRMRRFNLKHQEKQEKKMCDNFFRTRNSDPSVLFHQNTINDFVSVFVICFCRPVISSVENRSVVAMTMSCRSACALIDHVITAHAHWASSCNMAVTVMIPIGILNSMEIHISTWNLDNG